MTGYPRERMIADGGDRVGADELIAVVLGTRGVAIARSLLDHCGGLVNLSRASPPELTCVPGVGSARASRLAAAFHLGRRAFAVAAGAREPPIASAADVYERLRPRVVGLSQELFLALALDVRNVVIEEIEVARGCLTGVEVHPREVFRPLIRAAAAAVIVAHNHPSGDPTPSPEDVALTDRLRNVGELVGIPLLDHVVLGRNGYASLAERMWS